MKVLLRQALLSLLWCLSTLEATAQKSVLNISGIHQLVAQSQSEYELQISARNKQLMAGANEQANLTLMERVKNGYRQLQERYQTLGMLVSAAEVGVSAAPMVSRIMSNQALVLEMTRKNPALIAIGYESQLEFAGQGQALMRYLAGLLLSAGDVNQMKASDRKVLFNFVIAELSRIQDLSGNMVRIMQYADMAALLKAANPFQYFIDTDLAIGKDIIQNAKYLK
jgi:hypothetical protein